MNVSSFLPFALNLNWKCSFTPNVYSLLASLSSSIDDSLTYMGVGIGVYMLGVRGKKGEKR